MPVDGWLQVQRVLSGLMREQRTGIVGTVTYCLAHLSPVVKDNDGALLLVHCDRAHVSLA